MKKWVSAALGFGVTAFFLWLALRKVSIAELQQAASEMDVRYLIPLVMVAFSDLFVRAVRWRLLLDGAPRSPEAPPPSVWMLFQLEAIGLGLNNVLLFRLGEFIRGYLASVELSIPGVYAMATIFVERALDMIALLTLFVTAASFYPETVDPRVRTGALVAVIGLSVGLVVVTLLDRELEAGRAAWVGKLPERFRDLVQKAALGSRALRSPLVMLATAALSLSLWLVDSAIYFLAAKGMGLSEYIGYGRSVVILSTAAAASAVPAAPGAFGTYEQFVKALLVTWHVPEAAALAYAGIVHLLFYLVSTLLGLVFLYKLGHTFGSLSKAAQENLR
ncbi:MAG: flippase-like domain-containing protein [Elusimicrobia bacterium]|nr:flippase-like domain-containing protein [Elusimicrobiota bacterium]